MRCFTALKFKFCGNSSLVSCMLLCSNYNNLINPLKFVYESRNLIKRKNSWPFYLIGKLMESIRKYKGQQGLHLCIKVMDQYRIAKNHKRRHISSQVKEMHSGGLL